MIKTSLLRYAAIGMATVSMAGFAAASTVTIDTTGADSNQQVDLNNNSHVSLHNNNNVGVGNVNVQGAQSGDVKAYKNTSVDGSVRSGDASNGNMTHTEIGVENSGMGASLAAMAGMGTPNDTVHFDTTGADSNQQVTINNNHSVKVTNNNDVQVVNENVQSAQSGNVSATKNTTVGGLSSGAASNTSNTSTAIHVQN